MSLFLVHYPEFPVLIPEKGKVTIGRSDTNTIVLTEARVSRQHAIIEYKKSSKGHVISDCGSSNGTYLNGKKLVDSKATKVADRDKIRIASTIFTIRLVDNPDAITEEFKEFKSRINANVTEIITMSTSNNFDSQSTISGNLAQLCAVELFQMLEYGGKSGILTLTSDIGNGTFTLDRGKVIIAEFEKEVDEKAFFTALKCSSGTFSLVPQSDISVTPRITTHTTILLMEGCRLLDEANEIKNTES